MDEEKIPHWKLMQGLPDFLTEAEWMLTGKIFVKDLTSEDWEKIQEFRRSLEEKRMNSGNSNQKEVI